MYKNTGSKCNVTKENRYIFCKLLSLPIFTLCALNTVICHQRWFSCYQHLPHSHRCLLQDYVKERARERHRAAKAKNDWSRPDHKRPPIMLVSTLRSLSQLQHITASDATQDGQKAYLQSLFSFDLTQCRVQDVYLSKLGHFHKYCMKSMNRSINGT